MLFNSFSFLIFFPIVVLIYFIIPKRWQWLWLLVSSYYFYMCWNPKYVLLLFLSTLVTWVGGILISNCKSINWKKICVSLCMIINLGILAVFKYFNFFVDSLNFILRKLALQSQIKNLDILLPVGISFYTFQAVGYIIDVYRGEESEKNFGKYALFVSFFPQLVAGPIERSDMLLMQIKEEHELDGKRILRGLELMLWGFFEKLVIADRCGLLVSTVFDDYMSYEGFEIVIAAVFFAIQIYCDFAGYSDIAIGAAEVLGVHLMKNFDRPYFSCSIKEFWERWHISLSSWLRDYLYIPLGGNRRGKIREYINTMIVFLISGLWHGANWTYVIWGGVAWNLSNSRKNDKANKKEVNFYVSC